ncbi:MAG: hypothetical protein A3J97_00935 [Spirochaetes bacterium RIFOXYC1_FULL_54_7]|nr:MAG: hypothetical protein A3J97_00935 [Spirochaetes bacterium RIFOXYC1_FULL_54_7]
MYHLHGQAGSEEQFQAVPDILGLPVRMELLELDFASGHFRYEIIYPADLFKCCSAGIFREILAVCFQYVSSMDRWTSVEDKKSTVSI